MQVSATLNTGQKYRIFAGAGRDNLVSEDGVTIVLQACSKWEIELSFWTREDAVRFFRHAAAAAEECVDGEAGGEDTLMAEDVTAEWKAKADG